MAREHTEKRPARGRQASTTREECRSSNGLPDAREQLPVRRLFASAEPALELPRELPGVLRQDVRREAERRSDQPQALLRRVIVGGERVDAGHIELAGQPAWLE